MKIDWESIDLKSQKIIQKTTDDFFKNREISSQTQVSFHFLTPLKIKILNKKYRHENRPTDVLSFPLWPNLKKAPKTTAVHLGDVFICPEIMKQNALSKQVSVEQELEKIVDHSLKHLIGQHHK